jgi:hypothetical protein
MTAPQQQKLKIAGPVVITANRLADGAVVYRTSDGQWTTELELALIVSIAPTAQTLLADASADANTAVDAYVAPVRLDPDGAIRPGNLRERIRRTGPTFDLPRTFGI